MLWYFKKDNCSRYQLSPYNDHWFNIKEEKETYIIGEFNSRYDRDLKRKEAITQFMVAFDYVEMIQ